MIGSVASQRNDMSPVNSLVTRESPPIQSEHVEV